jgi:hypothetical protein
VHGERGRVEHHAGVADYNAAFADFLTPERGSRGHEPAGCAEFLTRETRISRFLVFGFQIHTCGAGATAPADKRSLAQAGAEGPAPTSLTNREPHPTRGREP